MLTPSPDRTTRVRIVKSGQTGPSHQGPSAPSSLLHLGQRVQRKGHDPLPQIASRWVDRMTTFKEFISQLEVRHRATHEGWDYSRRAPEDEL